MHSRTRALSLSPLYFSFVSPPRLSSRILVSSATLSQSASKCLPSVCLSSLPLWAFLSFPLPHGPCPPHVSTVRSQHLSSVLPPSPPVSLFPLAFHHAPSSRPILTRRRSFNLPKLISPRTSSDPSAQSASRCSLRGEAPCLDRFIGPAAFPGCFKTDPFSFLRFHVSEILYFDAHPAPPPRIHYYYYRERTSLAMHDELFFPFFPWLRKEG